MKNVGFIVVIAGPTGVGETTVTLEAVKHLPGAMRLVGTTSRPKRPGEREGREYHFITKAEFRRRIRRGHFLEYTYIRNRGVYYGTYCPNIDALLARGKILFANLDLKGMRFMKRHYPTTYAIFIAPENIAQIRARKLQQHPNITAKELAQRIANARAEMRESLAYDTVVVNREGHLRSTVRIIVAGIQKHQKQLSN